MVKVMGSISATPMAAERPGMQPMMMPMATPAAIIRRLMGVRALRKPAPISDKVSSMFHALLYFCRALITVPTGSLTPRNFWNAKKIKATITTTVIAENSGGTRRYNRTTAIKITVEM